MTFDARALLRYYEVHYWPNTGHVILINADPAYGRSGPVVTDIRIRGEAPSTPYLRDSTTMIALALAEAGKPAANLFEHNRSVYQIDIHTMARTKVPSTSIAG